MNKYELQQVISKWVNDNFGESEAKDPSWNIESLSEHVANHFTEKEKYNGWSNYATWRIKLELLDGEADAIREDGQTFATINDLADHLRQMVDDYFELNLGEIDQAADNFALSTMHSYSGAFIQEVNFYEIAEAMAYDNKGFVKELK